MDKNRILSSPSFSQQEFGAPGFHSDAQTKKLLPPAQ